MTAIISSGVAIIISLFSLWGVKSLSSDDATAVIKGDSMSAMSFINVIGGICFIVGGWVLLELRDDVHSKVSLVLLAVTMIILGIVIIVATQDHATYFVRIESKIYSIRHHSGGKFILIDLHRTQNYSSFYVYSDEQIENSGNVILALSFSQYRAARRAGLEVTLDKMFAEATASSQMLRKPSTTKSEQNEHAID